MQAVILAVGGTGGHILPAIKLSKELPYQGVFVGVGLSRNHLIKQQPLNYKEVSGGPFNFFGLFKLIKGVCQSIRFFLKEKPLVVVGFGSYHSFPALAAAFLLRIPIILYEPNAICGRVNRLFSPVTKAICMYFPQELPNVYSIGFNSLQSIHDFTYFGLEKTKQTLLIFGGSQGSKAINACYQYMPLLFSGQVLHFVGKNGNMQQIQEHYQQNNIMHCVKQFEAHMTQAYSCSNLAITRAGAATIKELIEHEVPAIVIPYPSASEDHQKQNGLFFQNQVGGGICIEEKNLSFGTLKQAIQQIEKNAARYQQNMQQFKQNHLGNNLTTIITNIIEAK